MRVVIFLVPFLKFSSSSVYKSVKRNTDDKIIQEEIDDDDLSDFFDEVANAQEVLEVPIEYEDDNKPIPIRDVWAVRDGKAELPCDINPPDPTDQVYLVLWYRDLAGKPLYSYDLRGKPPQAGKHWSAEPPFGFGQRARFRVPAAESFTALVIKDVTLLDEGVYRCRVDYRNSPTRNMKLNLTVVEEPHAPQIKRDDDILQDVGGAYAGPFNEGEELKLLCEVHGGRPLPQVFWYVDDQAVPGRTHTEPGKDVVVNRLRYSMLSRDMNNKRISCVAKNNEINDPKTRTVTVQMNLRPQSVKILRKETYLTEGQKVHIVCEAQGSEPPAQIRWYLGESPQDNFKVEHKPLGSTTKSILIFEPGENDNKRRLSCRAFNKNIPGSTIEDHWDVLVMYKPRLRLTLGRTLNPSEIKEGDDVYFECRIVSNPEATKLEWYHEEQRLVPNASGGILLSNQSLVIQGVKKKNNGAYTCRAQNSQGEATSNAINLSIKYRPVCDNKTVENNKIAVDTGSVTIVDCFLDANPPASKVYWISSKQGHQSKISSSQYTLMDGFSRLSYQPDRESDYGELLCYGANNVGTQMEPCVFSIEAAGRPYPLVNCHLSNASGSYVVNCEPGFDGGLTQTFNLEIWLSDSRSLVRNMTRSQPRFLLSGLHSTQPVDLQVYAWNRKGRSEAVTVVQRVIITQDPGSQSTELPPSIVMKEPLFFVIGGAVLGFLLITLLSLIWYLKRRSVGKKLAVVEVCVGRQVDRVRGRERRQAGEQEQVINNRLEEAEDRDIRPYSAKAEQYEKSLFPAISSDRSNEDISNLQLKGSTAPTPGLVISPSPRPSSVACDPGHPGAAKPRAIIPAKPILKHRKPEPGPASSEECQPGPQRYYGDGNWYTNPMDSSYFPTNSSYHQDSTATFPGPVPSGYSTLQARHSHGPASASKFSYYAQHQQPGLAPHKIPPPSGFSGAPVSQGGARYRNMGHLGTLPRPQPQEFSRSAAEKEYLMSGGPGYPRGVTSGAGPESNI